MTSNATDDRLLTAPEVAEYLGVKLGTVYNKVSRREIPFEKAGRMLRFRRSTIDEWIQSHPVPATDAEAIA